VAVGLASAQLSFDLGDLIDSLWVVVQTIRDTLAGVQHGGVVAPSEGVSDRLQ
jgi:hypothetical protein